MSGGIGIAIIGVLVITQILGGCALERLGWKLS